MAKDAAALRKAMMDFADEQQVLQEVLAELQGVCPTAAQRMSVADCESRLIRLANRIEDLATGLSASAIEVRTVLNGGEL
jgi:hypothetical protein